MDSDIAVQLVQLVFAGCCELEPGVSPAFLQPSLPVYFACFQIER